MRNASKKTIEQAVKHAKANGIHVIVGWDLCWSLRAPAGAFPWKKTWPGRVTQNKFREIACIIKPDGEISYF